MKRFALLALAACGSAQHRQASWLDDVDARVPAGTISAYVTTVPVAVQGIWFPDADCRTRFATARVISGDELAALGHCLDGLHLARDPRGLQLPDVDVFQYGAGLEVEARFRHDRDGAKLISIGYIDAADRQSTLPTITQETLESLRIAGDPNAGATGHMNAWFEVCLGQDGAVTDAQPVGADTPATAATLAVALQSWKFRPFVLADQATPACSWIELAGPGSTTNAIPVPPLDPTILANLPKRVKGDTQVVPDDAGKRAIIKAGLYELVQTFRLCVDPSGKVTKLAVYTSSGVLGLDQMYARVIDTWQYERSDAPSCGAITFDFIQPGFPELKP